MLHPTSQGGVQCQLEATCDKLGTVWGPAWGVRGGCRGGEAALCWTLLWECRGARVGAASVEAEAWEEGGWQTGCLLHGHASARLEAPEVRAALLDGVVWKTISQFKLRTQLKPSKETLFHL